jgi:type I site-specific restriction endonuclease
VLDEFDLIIRNCAAKISKHFTKLTAVINENNQYEFPSVEIHKSVIDRLILNDSKHFKKLLTHVRAEFKVHEAEIREKYPHCAQNMDRLLTEVNLLRKDQINIDHYMSDLRRHALEEYNELYLRETQQ